MVNENTIEQSLIDQIVNQSYTYFKGTDISPIGENPQCENFSSALLENYFKESLKKYPPIIGEETMPVIKIRELKQGITSNTDKANTHLDKKYIIQNGDILFSWSGSLEVVIWQHGKGALNQYLYKDSSEEFPKWFYYFWIVHHLREFKGVAANKATTMGHISRIHLDLAQVIIPDEISLNKYNRTFNPLIEKLENNSQQIQTLKKTRYTLLPKLMSGQVRINEI